MIIKILSRYFTGKLVALFLLCFLLNSTGFSQEDKKNHLLYSGGMLFFQPGYTMTKNEFQSVESLGIGIGGLLRFYIKEHLTLGVIGGNQKTSYSSTNSDNSYISLGYGGVFFGYTLLRDKFRFCAAVSLGMGRIKNLHIEDQNGVVLNSASFYSYPAKVAYPMLSFDYFITKKISVVFQTIYLTAHYNKNDLYFCPVFQLGIVFNR
ncbi:MAG: hypothetical protein LBQ22_02175 [Bacteroidales bacterium]|jgi:hypothetical protein|nr:hypothetical protein [Bacteroidales bacterium]